MSTIRTHRLIAAIENGTLSSSALEALLVSNAGRRSEIQIASGSQSVVKRILGSELSIDTFTQSAAFLSEFTKTRAANQELINSDYARTKMVTIKGEMKDDKWIAES